jgi:hypothetical protein
MFTLHTIYSPTSSLGVEKLAKAGAVVPPHWPELVVLAPAVPTGCIPSFQDDTGSYDGVNLQHSSHKLHLVNL